MKSQEKNMEQSEALQANRFDLGDLLKSLEGKSEFPIAVLGSEVAVWLDNKIESLGYNFEYENSSHGVFVSELARNAAESSEDGVVEVSVEDGILRLSVSNGGSGFGDKAKDKINLEHNHGLDRVLRYADTLTIETNGRRYEKRDGQIILAGESPIESGVKVTLTKKLEPKS